MINMSNLFVGHGQILNESFNHELSKACTNHGY